MFQDITIEELLELHNKRTIQLVDVRSPGEFGEFTIPGSINMPLFDDEERKEIGTLYKQVSVQAAKERGLEIVSAKLPAFVKGFAEIQNRIAVFCWRGGMRSRTTATVLSLMGIHVYRLAGGIRAYRQWVVSTLEQFPFRPKCVVISGNTGTGKTAILQTLAAEGYPVVDLERLAGHRGSIFGGIGLKPSNQKEFEALLVHELLKYNDSPYIIIEGESKRIGKIVMPGFLVEAKETGLQLLLELPMSERVRNILADYRPEENPEACMAAFQHIRKRIHTPVSAQIEQAMQEGRYPEAVELLLAYYYDEKYEHAGLLYENEPVVCQANNSTEAARLIKQQLNEWFGVPVTSALSQA
jgi:tRNA 2-selenouridine synthase